MNKITEYSWWGESDEPPEHLKTKKQLAKMGLKPALPVGVIHTKKYDLYLYDSSVLKKMAKSKIIDVDKSFDYAWNKYKSRYDEKK